MGYSQLSTRYVDPAAARMVVPAAVAACGDEEFVRAYISGRYARFKAQLSAYNDTLAQVQKNFPKISKKQAQEVARHDAPPDMETALVCTMNLRALLHFLRQRGSIHAAAEIRALAHAIWLITKSLAGPYLADIEWHIEKATGVPYAENVPTVSP